MSRKIIVGICIVLLLFCLFTGNVSAKPAVAWEKNLGTPRGSVDCYVNSIKQTPDGNYILAGSWWCPSGSGRFGEGGFWTKINLSGGYVLSGEWEDINDIKIASVYQIGDDNIIVGNKEGHSIIMRSSRVDDRGLYLLDKCWKKTFEEYIGIELKDLPPSVLTRDNKIILINNERSKVRLTKIDTEGNVEWDKHIGEGYCWANSITSTSDGEYILAGWILTGEKAKLKPSGVEGDSYDTYLIKIDSEGNIKWSKRINVGQCDKALSIKQTTDGGFIISGMFRMSAKKEDQFLMKTDLKGNNKWVKEGIGGKIVDTPSEGAVLS